MTARDPSPEILSSPPLPISLLWQPDWQHAAALFWLRVTEISGVRWEDVATDFWSGKKDPCNKACRTFADRLFAGGRGEEALSALMLAVDPTELRTFEIVLPQLIYAIDQLWEWSTEIVTKDYVLQRLSAWRRSARGDFADSDSNIFRIAQLQKPDEAEGTENLLPADKQNEGEREPEALSVVVMPRGKATKLNDYQTEYKDLLDAKLPLRLAHNVGAVRAKLIAEYPHAVGAIDLVLRDLREGKPVRLSPILLMGPAGAGKTRLVRRLFGDLFGIGVYCYDGGGASDSMFGGSPKAWGNTTPSVPVRAVSQMHIANPVVLVDELEKAGTSSRNGRLWHALLPHLERETARCYRDVSLDAELDLSWISHIATANSVENLPAPLKDRYRIIRVPAPSLADLPALAVNIMRELAKENGEPEFVWPLANDEIEVMGRAWEKAGFSIRKLQKIVAATLTLRDSTAARH
ncbi:AAA family ATPase [Bradyrhizobium sp. Arg62]|uniref:AAA family ATPase n=1 Tax=Bradyrhizobium brasilense TaxID=1419277 RepID=UPI001E3D9395|nr:AAA family ATPase [Bradyrhizobium brasilense]MCC8944194.1 AAA family ATPase [Bradyrhizobium brasilense]